MIDHVSIQLALRARLLTLSVASTGAIAMSATATGYARATGSFLADGFAMGMEIVPAGFVANPVDVITAITALTITTAAARTVEASAGGRTLAAGLPASRAWENIAFEPTAGVPWVEEQYLPGPSAQVTLGPNGELEVLPQYAPRVYAAAETGLTAARYADALLRLFAPRTAIPLANGDVLRVRSDAAPYPGQLLQPRPGFAMKPVTIPCRLRTQNLI